jgi:DNA replication and repair protein RecF
MIHFKNHLGGDLIFSDRVNCLLGDNGSGKTNILDALHYLCFCKSYFNPIDAQNITHGEPFMLIKGEFERLGESEIVSCGVKKGAKKVFKRNEKAYERLMDHIGRFPAVIIAPDDAEIVRGGSEIRRRFLDIVISQYDKTYLEALVDYNRSLLQRNNLFKYFAENRIWDVDMIEPWDARMVPLAIKIAKARRDFISKFTPVFNSTYEELSGGAEKVSLDYESKVGGEEKDFLDVLNNSRENDRRLRRTTCGVHRDDLVFKIHGHQLKKFGSQGQQKTFLVALRLAQLTFLEGATGVKPILLLDDIFDKIDDKRVRALMKRVTDGSLGQVFITDTHLGRIPEMFKSTGAEVRVFEVINGEVNTLEE